MEVEKGGPGSGRRPGGGRGQIGTAASTVGQRGREVQSTRNPQDNVQGAQATINPNFAGGSRNVNPQPSTRNPQAENMRGMSVRVVPTKDNTQLHVVGPKPSAQVRGHSVLDNLRVALAGLLHHPGRK